MNPRRTPTFLALGLLAATALRAQDNPPAPVAPPETAPTATVPAPVTPAPAVPDQTVPPLPVPGAAASAPVTPAVPALTLEECVRRALANNFDVEIARYNPQIAKEFINIARDPYQPVITATASRSHSELNATDNFPQQLSDTTIASAGISQQFYTGTSFGISSGLDRSRADITTTALNPAYSADVTLTARQQLLRGFGINANKAAVKAAEAGYQSSQLTYKAAVLTVVQNTENAYYQLVFASDQLNVHRDSLNLAQVLYNEAVARKETGVATDLDVFTADVAVQSARRQVLLDEQFLKDSQDQLLAIIGRFQLDTQLTPGKLPDIDEGVPVYASSYQMALQTQPDYQAALASVEQSKYNVTTAKSNARPSLSVGGAVGLNGAHNDATGAYNSAFENNGNSWQVDVSLTYPWGQVGDKARYRQSLATLNQSQSHLQQLEQTIQVQVRSAVRAVETNHESVAISVKATELAVKQYDLQKAKFDAGLATSRDVLQSQTDLETARLNELQARVSLQNAHTALHRLEGSSLQRYGLELP